MWSMKIDVSKQSFFPLVFFFSHLLESLTISLTWPTNLKVYFFFLFLLFKNTAAIGMCRGPIVGENDSEGLALTRTT